MRFQGKLRFPDQGAADLDVVVEVSDTHVRLSSADESLGSWCLSDVVAHRVVANEFELDLQGDTVVFLAEDPINFAYGAVQGMAEGWARYRSMNPVSRRRAVASARRKSEPSRLQDARRVFVAAGSRLLIDEPTPAITDREETGDEMAIDLALEADEVVDEQVAGDEVDERVAEVVDEVVVEEEVAAEVVDEVVVEEEVVAEVVDEVVVEEEAAAEVVDEVPVVEEPAEDGAAVRVDEGAAESVPPSMQVPAGRLPRLNAFPPRAARSTEASPTPETNERVDDDAAASGPTEEALSEATPELEPAVVDLAPVSATVASEPELAEDTADVPHAARRKRRRLHAAPTHDHRRAAPEGGESPGEAQPDPDPAPVESPALGSSTASAPTDSASAEQASETPVAHVSPVGRVAWRAPDAEPDSQRSTAEAAERAPLLGAFKDGHHPAETTGLRASVKSIFGRADKDHEHSYVESTTAVGLTRRVCLECGHVSIGVSD